MSAPIRPAPIVTYLQALVLGLVQGLTEFLPVSSSGHLQAIPFLFGWESASLTFDVLVHTGTLLAVVWYFREDLWALATGAVGVGGTDAGEQRQARLLIALLAIGSVPAAIAGLLFADVFEAAFDSPRMVAGFLYVTALLLWGAEHLRTRRVGMLATRGSSDGTSTHHEVTVSRGRHAIPAAAAADNPDPGGGIVTGDDVGRGVGSLRLRDAIAIGLAQAVSIFPGVSRAGTTIAAGMALGLSRAAAARFSFLLSIPVILGATVFTLRDVGTMETGTLSFGPGEIVLGMVSAAASGYWAIRFLLRLVVGRDLLGFARYVAAFGTVLLAATFLPV